MKIKHLKVSALFMAAALLTTSCVGSFSLFNRVAKWNMRATNSKFLNEIIFLLISPAYVVCTTVDALVLNTIEFWTGNNPLAQKVGTTFRMASRLRCSASTKTVPSRPISTTAAPYALLPTQPVCSRLVWL